MFPKTLELGVSCRDASGIVPNCNLTVTHRAIPNSGGHEHDDAARPKGSFSPSSINTGATGRVKVVYTAPEPSGEIEVTLSGTTAGGVPVTPDVATILVRIKDLQELPANGTGYSTTASTLHGTNNRFSTGTVVARLQQVVSDFRAALQAQQVPDANIPTIVWTGLSLPLGGVFDVDANGNGSIDNLWLPPHASHRFGNDVDMRIRNIPGEYRDELSRIIRAAGFFFPVQSESPGAPNASHWHLRRR